MPIQSLDLIYVGEFTENKKFSKINFHFLTNFYYRLLSAVKSAFLQCYITYMGCFFIGRHFMIFYRWYSIWRRHRRSFRPHPPFPMFSRRLRGGLWCFNVLTPVIVVNWVVIRLKIIVTIFATFLSTELYAFEFLS